MTPGGGTVEAYRSFVNPYRLEAWQAVGLPFPLTAAEGAWIEDAEGRRYLDLFCAFGAATLGHRAPAVLAALRRGLESRVPFTSPLGAPAESGALAEALCVRAGHGLTKTFFSTSGSEGIEAALKFAVARTGRRSFIAFDRAYHGMTLGALGLCGADAWRDPFAALGLTVERAPFGDLDRLEDHLRRLRPAAVVAEPVQGMGGGRRWGRQGLEGLAELCRAHGALLIFDEVLTGLGRTGRWFAFHEGGSSCRPDLVVVSKGLTGGAIPLGAVLMSDETYEAVFAGRPGIHASTFEAHLLGAVVGLAVLEEIEERGLLEQATRLGERARQLLLGLRQEGLAVTGVHGAGLLLSIEIDDSLRQGDLWGAVCCRQRLVERGVLVNLAAQNLARLNLTPPLTLAPEELELFCQRLREALC